MVTRTGIDAYTQRSNRHSRLSMNGLPQRNMSKDRGTFKSYHKPIRSRPTPTGPATKNPSFTPRSSSLLPIQRITEDEMYAIGLALGSPTHPPQMHAATQQAQTGRRTVTRTAGDESPDKHGLSRSLSRKLNIFSRSKSRRGRDPEPSSHQTPRDASKSPKTGISPKEPSRGDQNRDGTEQSTPIKGSRPKYTPIIIPTHAEPILSERIEPKPRTQPRSLAPFPPPKDLSSLSDKSTVEVVTVNQDSAPPSHPQPMLDVEIPTVTLDRYSVMFGNVLRQKNTPSLLARRQATLERLQTVSENRPPENKLLRPQRPSSQVPKGSPSFHLFPKSPASRVNSPLASRSRANTSPAILPSPLRHPLEATEKKPAASTENLNPPTSPVKDDKMETPRSGTSPEHPRLVSKFHRKKSTSSVAGSPTTVISPTTAKQKLRNSSRQEDHIVFMSPSWKSKPSRSAASPEIVRSPKTPQTATEKKPLDDPVQVSIARQISISQQQRKMLEPFRSHEKLNRANSVANAAARVTVGAGKRLAETKSATPKLVYMEPGNSENQKKAHRASERVIVEGV